ncbi:hypothetical protein Y032_0769g2196 [Ancylostoma ceylanicum]|uniref:Reverse transcriptase domain-containing protein n=1 Tax=Ancylostoma ceylanicum TaxID=53326 RepID=A0A016WEK3_9BILA|nr:hypothetical protein Y032_0769g2196 [Ancylostoma ceylanicum]
MYADDIAVVANDEAEAASILDDISLTARTYGLIVKAERTKVLTTDGTPVVVRLNEAELEQVQNFEYLRSIAQEKKVASSMESLSRIGVASTAFGSLRLPVVNVVAPHKFTHRHYICQCDTEQCT